MKPTTIRLALFSALTFVLVIFSGNWQTALANNTKVFHDIVHADYDAPTAAENATYQTEAATPSAINTPDDHGRIAQNSTSFGLAKIPYVYVNAAPTTCRNYLAFKDCTTVSARSLFAVMHFKTDQSARSFCHFVGFSNHQTTAATTATPFDDCAMSTNHNIATTFSLPYFSQVNAFSTHATTPWTQTSRTEIVVTSTGDASDHASFHNSATHVS